MGTVKKAAKSIGLPSGADIGQELNRAKRNVSVKNVGGFLDRNKKEIAALATGGMSALVPGWGVLGIDTGDILGNALGGGGGGVDIAQSQDFINQISKERDEIKARRGQFHQIGDIERAKAAQIGFDPDIDMGGALSGQAQGFARQLGGMGQLRPEVNMGADLRARTMGFADRLANTNVPSTAMLQHRLATDRGMKQALSLAASQGNPRALRDAMAAQGQLQSTSALQSGLVASQEAQRQAQQLAQAGQMMTGLRGQDISGSTAAGQMALKGQAQRAAQLGQAAGAMTALRGQTIQGSTAQNKMQLERAAANAKAQNEIARQNALEANKAKAADVATRTQTDRDVAQQTAQTFQSQRAAIGDRMSAQAGIAGAKSQQTASIIGAVGAIGAAAASDINLKENIRPADDDIDDFLEALTANKYNYKDSIFGEGDKVSPMAQDLEKSEIGESAVYDEPMGKMVDYDKLMPPMLAAMGKMHREIKGLREFING